MFKKFLTLALAVVGVFTLASCGPTDTGLTDAELLAQIAEAMEELSITSSTSSDLTLPNTGLHDVVITWESQNTDYIANDGTVTRPTKTVGNKTVTIVATLTLEDQALTKSFQVTVEAAADYNDAEKVALDKAALFLQEGQLFADLTLPTSGSNGTTITWESDKPAYITNAGEVTRPAVGEGEELVTLTATITSGTESDTKVFQFRVQEDVEVNTIAELKATSPEGENVLVRALVVGIFDKGAYIGYYIYDGTGFMYVHMGASSNTYNVTVGNVYQIAGEYDVYFGMPQIAYPTEEAEIDMEITMPTATVVTPADIMAYTTEVPKVKFSEYINITGTVTYDGTYYYLEDDAGNAIELNDDSDIALVIAELGKSVTMNGFYHSYHSSHGNHQISFTGNAADLTVNELPDAEALAADLAVVGASVPGATLMDITLPTEGANGTLYTEWTSDNTAVFANDGTFVAGAATTVTVTFTATATKGSETGTATIEVVVPAASTLLEANAVPKGDYVLVTGVVFSESHYGFHIWANNEFLFVNDTSLEDDIAVGDELTLVLELSGYYHGASQFKPLEYTNNSSGNALPTPEVVELADVLNLDYPYGKLVTVTGEVYVEVGQFTDVFIMDPTGRMTQVHYRSNAGAIEAFDGKVVTFDVIIYGYDYVWFEGESADVTEVTAGFTDAEVAHAILANVVDGLGDLEGRAADFTFPATYEESTPNATITWASDTTAVVANDGTVTIQNGTTGTATITVTVDFNGTTATRDLDVTVIDGDDLTPTDIATALAEDDGTVVVIQGVVSALNKYGDPFIQDADGTAIIAEYFPADVAVGDEVVVLGKLDTDTFYDNRRRMVDPVLLSTPTTGNTVFVITDATSDIGVADNSLDITNKLYQMDLTVTKAPAGDALETDSIFDKYGYVFFAANGTDVFKMDYEDYAEYFGYVYAEGDILTMTFIMSDIDFNSIRIIPTILPTLTDAQNLAAAKGMLDLDDSYTEDITLPAAMADFNATITWSSDTPAVVSDAGVVVRPASDAADATVVLTATIDVNGTTDTKAFTITIPKDAPAVVPSTVTEVWAAGYTLDYLVYTDVTVTGIVVAFSDDGYILQDPATGEMIGVEDGTNTPLLGDEVVLTAQFNGVRNIGQIRNVTGYSVESNGNSVVFDKSLAVDIDFTVFDVTAYAGKLVKITGPWVKLYSGGTSYARLGADATGVDTKAYDGKYIGLQNGANELNLTGTLADTFTGLDTPTEYANIEIYIFFYDGTSSYFKGIVLDDALIFDTTPKTVTEVWDAGYTLDYTVYTDVVVTGIVAAFSDDGYILQDPVTGEMIGVEDGTNTPLLGDEVTLTAQFNGVRNVGQIRNVSSYTLESSGNSVVFDTTLAVDIDFTAFDVTAYAGKLVKVTGPWVKLYSGGTSYARLGADTTGVDTKAYDGKYIGLQNGANELNLTGTLADTFTGLDTPTEYANVTVYIFFYDGTSSYFKGIVLDDSLIVVTTP